jgi:hypothetical protein
MKIGNSFSSGARAIQALGALWLFLASQAGAAVHYVNVSNNNPAPPYTNWATAAQVIQEAIDIALPGDNILVTNGIYATGGRVVYGLPTNRIAITAGITVESVNGPAVTIIQGWKVRGTTNGNSAVRCVYMANGALLVGFTLTNGATTTAADDIQGAGGGVWFESVYHMPGWYPIV